MTKREQELVAALEAANEGMEWDARYFQGNVDKIELFDGKRLSGEAKAAQIQTRVHENRRLIERIKNSA